MLEFFDYFYYRCYSYYLKKDKEGIPAFWSSTILATVQSLNIIVVIEFFNLINNNIQVDKSKALITAFGFIFLNLIRYKYFTNFIALYEKWHKEPKVERVRRGRNILLYALVSLILAVGIMPLLRQLLK